MLDGKSASAVKLSAEAPNHCLTDTDFALDFIAHDLCRTVSDANDSQFQSLHGWRSVLPHQNVENIFGRSKDRGLRQLYSLKTRPLQELPQAAIF
ncbi:MAG: hypothetical protein I8H73_25170 [Pseudomonadales bacterium]|nr:hypothetical protein [Pseudomonadales bacterium]